MEVYAVCPYCKKKIGPLNESEKSIVEKRGPESGVISHFDCVYKSIHGKEFDWKDIKPRRDLLVGQFPKRKGDYNKVPKVIERPIG